LKYERDLLFKDITGSEVNIIGRFASFSGDVEAS
jgi:hypothetical protein